MYLMIANWLTSFAEYLTKNPLISSHEYLLSNIFFIFFRVIFYLQHTTYLSYLINVYLITFLSLRAFQEKQFVSYSFCEYVSRSRYFKRFSYKFSLLFLFDKINSSYPSSENDFLFFCFLCYLKVYKVLVISEFERFNIGKTVRQRE